jgi:hypothetical protein
MMFNICNFPIFKRRRRSFSKFPSDTTEAYYVCTVINCYDIFEESRVLIDYIETSDITSYPITYPSVPEDFNLYTSLFPFTLTDAAMLVATSIEDGNKSITFPVDVVNRVVASWVSNGHTYLSEFYNWRIDLTLVESDSLSFYHVYHVSADSLDNDGQHIGFTFHVSYNATPIHDKSNTFYSKLTTSNFLMRIRQELNKGE